MAVDLALITSDDALLRDVERNHRHNRQAP